MVKFVFIRAHLRNRDRLKALAARKRWSMNAVLDELLTRAEAEL